MIFRPYYYFDTGCAAYLFGCGTLGKCAVVDAQERDIDAYVDVRRLQGHAHHARHRHARARRSSSRAVPRSRRRRAPSTACTSRRDVAIPFAAAQRMARNRARQHARDAYCTRPGIRPRACGSS